MDNNRLIYAFSRRLEEMPYRIAVCGAMLLITSYLDIKKREVNDSVWIVFSVVGGLMGVFEYLSGNFDILQAVISVAVASLVGFASYYVGFFGGADAKALAVTSVLIPSFSDIDILPVVNFHPIPALSVLTNSTIVAAVLPIYYGIRNLVLLAKGEKIFQGLESESVLRKTVACLLGYRVKGKPKPFLLSLERTVDGRRRFTFELLPGDINFVTERDVWVTPGIPYLVFMTVGYFVLVLWGDIIAVLFRQLLGI